MNLCFPNIEWLYQPVFDSENVPYHLVHEDGAMEIPHNLMNLYRNLSIGTTRAGNRLNAWINHCPLAPPIAANSVAPMDMAAFHSVGPEYVGMHAPRNTLHIASIEPRVKALKHFHVMQHSSLDSAVSVCDYDHLAYDPSAPGGRLVSSGGSSMALSCAPDIRRSCRIIRKTRPCVISRSGTTQVGMK